jgi:phosphoribosylformylglycinamidine cyclo-ligase
MRYRDAGVDLSRSDALKAEIAREVRSTWGSGSSPLTGGFAGVIAWPSAGGEVPAGAPQGLLAATLDGVGTKLHLAIEAGRLADSAADVVYHGGNDLLVHGARPFACLDYIAQARLDPPRVLEAIRGLSRACREIGAVLLGGETAEMPDTYLEGTLDLAACLLGRVEPELLLDGSRVRPGDRLLALGSAGLHTNGFSLARRVLSASGKRLADRLPGGSGETIGDALLASHRYYGPALFEPIHAGRVHALAHVTGGGIAGNLVRVLPPGCRAWLEPPRELPAVFRWLIESGAIPIEDARATFNLGVGMVVVCAPDQSDSLSQALRRAGERVHELGHVESGERGVEWSSRP